MANHFWIINPQNKSESYCVNTNGMLVRLNKRYEFIAIDYNETLDILNKNTKQDKYSRCKEIFDKKFPQLDKDKIDLSKEQQSKLEEIFLTHKNL
jgi:deoxycytidine triphosphate deaminase